MGCGRSPTLVRKVDKMKKTASLLFVLILCVSMLAACNGVSSNDPNVGLWMAYSVDAYGNSMDVSDIYKDGDTTIELKSNGSCTLFLNGDEAGAKWKLNGTVLTISSGGIDYPGRIRNGVLEFEMNDDLTLFFSRDGRAPISSSGDQTPPPDTPSPSDDDTPGPPSPPTPSGEDPPDTPSPSPDTPEPPTPEPPTPESPDTPDPIDDDDGLAKALEWWDGDWYGSFYISETNAAYDSLSGHFEDIYAVIKTNPDGTATVYLWSDGYYDLGTVELEIEADSLSVMGSAVSTGGELFNYPVNYIDWYITPYYGKYSDMIEIIEFFLDTDGDWFNYEIFMRPWGMRWDDVSEADQPLYYDDWYLSVCNRPMLEVLEEYEVLNHSALGGSSSTSPAPPSPSESEAPPSPTDSGPPPTDSGPPPTDSGPPPTGSGPPPTGP